MEKYTNVTRFCLICNYLSKITPAIQSRCTRFRFAPLQPEQIRSRLELIIASEGVKATEEGKKALMDLAGGDMRRVINGLQSTHLAFPVVDDTSVYKCCGQPTRQDMNEIWSILTDDADVRCNYDSKCLEKRCCDAPDQLLWRVTGILEIQSLKGLAVQDMIFRLQFLVHDSEYLAVLAPRALTRLRRPLPVDEIEETVKMDILADMADVEVQASGGGNERLQVAALVGAFHKAAKALWQG